ncbi:MAG: DUF222 domain-containing protein, partial [Nocardioidaceae bacterium]|nr:DUF222 domain-containing protein [Nocardioidaceae bacterium]
QLPRYASVLDARADALEAHDQLELAHELASCTATLDWLRCKTASAFALRECCDPLVLNAGLARGGIAMLPVGGVDTPEVPESVFAELALAISCSEHAARDLVAVGLDLRYRLPQTNNDFGGGRITYAHAKVISEATRQLSLATVDTLDAKLAAAAQTRTPPRLRILAKRLVAKADPEGMRRRHQHEYDHRSTAMFPLGDGVAAFTFNHDLDTMCVIDDHLDAWARRRRLTDPHTGLDAHKADAAAHLLLGQHPLTGAALIPHPANGASPADGAGCRSTGRADAAHQGRPQLPTVADPSHFLPARTELRVHMSADTLLRLDDDSCELAGYGPITAHQARRLTLESATTTLRRVFTDPADDSVLFLDAGTYRFTRAQTETIATLHPISTFPGATTAAARCDTDHLVPYQFGDADGPDPPGQTVVPNAQPLRRQHHRLRTHLEWTRVTDPHDPHTTAWTSPHGGTYVVHDHEGA